MVDALRSERDSERKAHQNTRRDAQWRISVLEAQLARREAQLEACIAHTADCIPLQQSLAHANVKPMVQNEADKAIDTVLAKNRSLDAEVALLSGRVRGYVEFFHVSRPLSNSNFQVTKARLVPKEQLRLLRRSEPSSPHTRWQTPILASSSRDHIRPPAVPGPSRPSTQQTTSSCLPSPQRPSFHDGLHQLIHEHQSDTTQIIQGLDRQMAVMNAEIVAFRAERDRLAEAVSRERKVCGSTFPRHSKVDKFLLGSITQRCRKRRWLPIP